MESDSHPVVLITGAGTGVGRATALLFASRGYDVVVNYSRSEKEAEEAAVMVREHGVRARVVCCDVSDDVAVGQMIADVDAEWGRLDVLVNNAATTHFIDHHDLDALTEAMWDRMLAVNLKGPFFVCRAAADLLKAGEGGAIVNVSSVAGIVGRGSSIAYCASKAGLNTMTKSLARVMAPKVRVNAVCPGPINSRWIRQADTDWDLDEMVAEYPIPRDSEPDDIADAVMFFAVDSKMATGQILSIDGGQTL